jgi:hypothetical protein
VGPLARTTPDQPAPPIGPLAAAHPTHDLLLVAAWASDDLDGAARTAAGELIGGCSACAVLASDLRALAVATRSLPPARRPRDFALSRADAERLRPHGLRRLLAALAAPRSVSRPLAASLTTLGVAGLLLASLPGILPFGAAGAPGAALQVTGEERSGNSDTQSSAGASAAPEPAAAASAGPAASDAALAPVPSAEPPADTSSVSGTEGSGSPDDGAVRDVRSTGPPILVVVSLVLLASGLGLFALRRLAARSA